MFEQSTQDRVITYVSVSKATRQSKNIKMVNKSSQRRSGFGNDRDKIPIFVQELLFFFLDDLFVGAFYPFHDVRHLKFGRFWTIFQLRMIQGEPL